MWTRGVAGIVLCLVGAVWIAQGTGALGGSVMSGKGQYTALGVIVVAIGVALLVWAALVRRGRTRETH